jgi:hypothetical protein
MSALCRHFQSRDADIQAVRKVEGASSTAAAAADSTADLFVPLRLCRSASASATPVYLILQGLSVKQSHQLFYS